MHAANGRQADVAIVGAGLAGLCAARALQKEGASVLVLEARDRVGGRTLRREIAGDLYDIGGQWLGPGQERMLALTRELGLALFPTYHQGNKLLDHGHRGRIKPYSGNIPSVPLWHLPMLQAALSFADRLTRRAPTLSAAEAEAMDRQTLRDWQRRRIPSATVQGLMDVAVRTIFGAEAEELSLLYFLRYLHAGGGLLKLAEIEGGAQQDRFVAGSQGVSLALAQALGDAVVLRAPVRQVAQQDDGVTLTLSGEEAGQVRARYAILAIPPPLAGRITYQPALPGARDALTQRMPMGWTTKVLAVYARPFWRERGLSGEVVCTGGFPFSAVFDNSPPPVSTTGHGALLGFCVGTGARRFAALPAEERRRESLAELRRYFGSEAGEPLAYVEQDWAQEPWSRGCPTSIAGPGVLTEFGAALRDPVGRLHFAGTETAERWTGYMDGAVESGERAAREVAARL